MEIALLKNDKREETHTPLVDIFETNVKRGVSVCCEGVSIFTSNVSRTAIVVAYGIFDLHSIAIESVSNPKMLIVLCIL